MFEYYTITPIHMLRKNVLAIAPKSEGGHYTNLAHKALGFSLKFCSCYIYTLRFFKLYKLLVVLVCETSLGRKIRGI